MQPSACSALATVADAAGHLLAPRADALVAHLVHALGCYGRRNVRCLCDAVSSLAAALGDALATPAFAAALLPPLLARCESHPLLDAEQVVVMQCLGAVLPALGACAAPFARPTLARVCAQAEAALGGGAACGGEGCDEAWDVCAAALEVAGAACEALGPALPDAAPPQQLVDLAIAALASRRAEVRSAGAALLADVAVACPHSLATNLRRVLEACAAALADPGEGGAASARAVANALWAMGEVVMQCDPPALAPFALPVLASVTPFLAARTGGKDVAEHAAIALGRVALRCPHELAPHAAAFAGPLCAALRRVRDDSPKEDAFRGLCALIPLNPLAVWPSFSHVAAAFASWRTLRDQALLDKMAGVLRGYKAGLPADWATAFAALEPAVAEKLALWFGV